MSKFKCLLPFYIFSSAWASPVQVELFMSSTCVHCHHAETFLQELRSPPIELKKYIINQDKQALDIFYTRIKDQKPLSFEVPTIFFCGTKWVGFDAPEHRGKKIAEALEYCHTHSKNGVIDLKDQQVLTDLSKAKSTI